MTISLVSIFAASGLLWAEGANNPLKKAAERGDAVAQFELGVAYDEGNGVPQDYKAAVSWYRKAAEQGNAKAQFNLGLMYCAGQGVLEDCKEGAAWLRKAANQGDANAQFKLGVIYRSGLDVPKDNSEAAGWFRKAAEQGSQDAQTDLGAMYERGEGMPQNYAEAVNWYRKAAEQGDGHAQVFLGYMYRYGKGIAQNYVESYKWYLLAAAQDNKSDQAEMIGLQSEMTREQVAEAQKLASQWKAAEGSAAMKIPRAPVVVAKEESPREVSVSDIDAPTFRLVPNPNNFALVVGIEKYQKLPAADFAEHDAKTMRNYLLRMGYPERNIIYLNGENATRSRFSSYLDEWLPKNVNGDSTVFVYFSGHGAPSAEDKQAYLMPWDSDAEFLKSTAYPLKQLYAALNRLKAKTKIVVLDSCFSGTGGRSVLVAGTRPLVPKVTANDNLGSVLLFAAASPDQITGTLDDQGHGLFTYYFLKGLAGKAKGASGAITASGLYRYLKPLVQDAAHRQNREQTPTLVGERNDVELVRLGR